jgi:hypothetical protein
MYANTTSKYPTNFLRGIELISEARNLYTIYSENYPYPTRHKFGMPNDNYYVEIWVDGMDWQHSYWAIEQIEYHDPLIQPFIVFNHHEEEEKFKYSFSELIEASLYYRRDSLWVKKGNLGIYTDTVWPFIRLFKDEERSLHTKLYSFEHANQERVVFWMNQHFIPEEYREKNWNSRNKATGHSLRPVTN